MKTSEILTSYLPSSENVSLTELWKKSTGDFWEDNIEKYDEPVALYLLDTGEFRIVTYITPSQDSWKRTFESQNAAWFIGFVAETDLINGSVYEMLQERIDFVKYQEDEYAEMKNS
jgi:hypothetical protein